MAYQTKVFLGIKKPKEIVQFSGPYAHLGYLDGNLIFSKLVFIKTDENDHEHYNSCIGVMVYSKYKGWS